MSIESEYRVNRDGWPSGEWDNEPDKLNWKTASGLPGIIVRAHHGALCGYVGLPPGHPCYGKDDEDELLGNISVHGGLTYAAAACHGNIRHVAEPGEQKEAWWLGFDCAHCWDEIPARAQYLQGLHPDCKDEYRNLAYVRGQVEALATQLAAIGTTQLVEKQP